MIYKLYKIRDARTGQYGTPLFVNKSAAEICEDYKNSIKAQVAHAERMKELGFEAEFIKDCGSLAQLKDCVVYSFGTYDDEKGIILTSDDVLEFRLEDLGDFSVMVNMPKPEETKNV